MDKKLFFTLTVFLLLGYLCYQLYLLFEPFFSSLLWAGILVILFHPIYKWLLARMPNRPEVASALMCLGLTLVILLPTTVILVILFQDLSEGAMKLSKWVQTIDWSNWQESKLMNNALMQHPLALSAYEYMTHYIDLESLDLKATAINTVQNFSQFILNRSKDFFKIFSGVFILVALIEINMFFLFRDGRRFVDYIKSLIPIESSQKNMVLGRMKEVIQASVFGTVATACAQGFLGFLAFLVLGVPSAILWGVVMTVMSFLPLAGPFVVWAPAAVYLFFAGHAVKAIILVLWGTLVIGTIDNLLRPILMSSVSSEESRINTLVLFLSVLGGIKIFGFLGIVLAPLLVVMTLTLLELLQVAFGATEGRKMMIVQTTLPAPVMGQSSGVQGADKADKSLQDIPINTEEDQDKPPASE